MESFKIKVGKKVFTVEAGNVDRYTKQVSFYCRNEDFNGCIGNFIASYNNKSAYPDYINPAFTLFAEELSGKAFKILKKNKAI